uniref:ENT domain-containing protein n=1 Tax=Aegilops tauschii subsp. strangulata TaxID=200361 RepID=A0A453L4Y2_AEGTS
MNPMGYRPYDSSGTDDDLPSSQNRGLRGRSFSGNGRASAGPFPYARPHNDLESQVHLVEQEAYTGVLRAFKVQSDALSWEKESLISELRKELRVSDEEHRELLNKVNEDGAIRGMRELRQGGGTPSGLHRGSRVLHDGEPGPTAKRQRPSHLMPSHSSGLQSPVMSSHSVPSSSKWGPSSASRGKRAKSVCLECCMPCSSEFGSILWQSVDACTDYATGITIHGPDLID